MGCNVTCTCYNDSKIGLTLMMHYTAINHHQRTIIVYDLKRCTMSHTGTSADWGRTSLGLRPPYWKLTKFNLISKFLVAFFTYEVMWSLKKKWTWQVQFFLISHVAYAGNHKAKGPGRGNSLGLRSPALPLPLYKFTNKCSFYSKVTEVWRCIRRLHFKFNIKTI